MAGSGAAGSDSASHDAASHDADAAGSDAAGALLWTVRGGTLGPLAVFISLATGGIMLMVAVTAFMPVMPAEQVARRELADDLRFGPNKLKSA